MNYIETSWQNYRKLVIPADAPEVQIDEYRLAFYAGATIIFTGMIQMMDGGDDPTEADMARMADIQREVDAFGQALDKIFFGTQEH